MTAVTTTGGPPELTRQRRRQRNRVDLLWAVVQAPLLVAVVALVLGVAAGPARGLWPVIFGEDGTDMTIPVGLSVGVGLSALLAYRARVWLHRVRLWRLRRSGESAGADVVWIAGDPTNLTATEGYVVFVRWRDLAGEHVGDRCYRFWDGAPHDFISRFGQGQRVVVRYPRARPHRFAIDIPYAPSAADLFI